MICPEHGEYESKILNLPFLNETRTSPCPQCGEIREKEYQAREIEVENKRKLSLINSFTARSGVPSRFKNKVLNDLQLINSKQKSILKIIKGYLQILLKGTSTCLIMCGKPGTGKTHIGCSIVMNLIKAGKESRIITTSNLMRRVKSTYHKESEETEDDVLIEYGSLYFLVIDEVGVQFGTETEKLIFYEIINRRYDNLLPTVLISNLTPDELVVFIGERAFDRFKEDNGVILAFDWESYRK